MHILSTTGITLPSVLHSSLLMLIQCGAGTSINWSAGCSTSSATPGVHEVTLSGSGRRAGAAKKGPPTLKTRSSLCKAAMFRRWLHLSAARRWVQDRARGVPVGIGETDDSTLLEEVLYGDAKGCAGGGAYAQSWMALKQDTSMFERWLQKPSDLEHFKQATWLDT